MQPNSIVPSIVTISQPEIFIKVYKQDTMKEESRKQTLPLASRCLYFSWYNSSQRMLGCFIMYLSELDFNLAVYLFS